LWAPLGEKGLSVNPDKTLQDASRIADFESKLDEIKKNLLKRRRLLITAGYDSVMRENAKVVHDKRPEIALSFPHLAKHVYNFSADVKDKEFVADMLVQLLKRSDVQEYQLFWFGWMLQSHLLARAFSHLKES
jgi:hypothetical protein